MNDKKNGYIILELDPSVDDWKVIEERIEEKRQEWNNLRVKGYMESRNIAEQNLVSLPEIQRRLKDSQLRKKEADEARAIKRREYTTRVEYFNEVLRVTLVGRKNLTPEQYNKICEDFKDIFTAEEIKKRIIAAGGQIGEDHKPDGKEEELVDDAVMAEIRVLLRQVSCSDLYDFLEEKPNTSLEKLRTRAEEIHKDEIEKVIAPERTSKIKLAGHCSSLFRSEEDKKKYDHSLAIETMHDIDHLIEYAASGGIIGPAQMNEILKQAIEKGVKIDNARKYVYNYAKKRGWKVIEDTSSIINLQQCGFCNHLAESTEDKYCRNCHRPLVVKCRNCGADVPSKDDACTQCSTKVGDTLKAMELLEKAKEYWNKNKDSQQAQVYIEQALYYWQSFPEAIELKQEIEKQIGKVQTELDKIKKLVRDREFESAETSLDRFAHDYPGINTGNLAKQIEEGLARAKTVYQEADSLFLENRFEEAFKKYQESLSYCHDFSLSIKGSLKCPPLPPSNAKAEQTTGHKTVVLKWSINSSGSVESVIFRKTGAPPIGEKDIDAKQIAATKETHWEDNDVPIGKTTYYAIYQKRDGLPSDNGAVTNPVFVVAEVSDFRLVPGDKSIDGTLVRPPCNRVDVVYKKGSAPSSLSDGERVSLLMNKSFSLTGLTNGEPYYFRAVCQYIDEKGTQIASQGVIQMAIPDEIPQPILQLAFERLHNGLKIMWAAVPKGEVHIYRSINSPAVIPGDFASQEKLELCGELISARVDSCSILDTNVPDGMSYYTPVTIIGMVSVFGKTHDRIELPEVTDVKLETFGGKLRILWRWPENINLVRIFWTYDNSSSIKDTQTKLVDSGSYIGGGGCFIDADCTQPISLSIHTTDNLNDQRRISSGVPLMYMPSNPPPQANISYTIEKPIFGSKLTIYIQCDEGYVNNINFVLVGAKYAAPLNINDGIIICEFKGIYLKKGEKFKHTCSVPIKRPELILGLLAFPENASSVIIKHPGKAGRTIKRG